jgi:hypothetical protein
LASDPEAITIGQQLTSLKAKLSPIEETSMRVLSNLINSS